MGVGVYIIFLAGTQRVKNSRKESVRKAEFLQSGGEPAHKLVVVAFGDDGNHIVVETEVSATTYITASEHIARDKTGVVVRHLTFGHAGDVEASQNSVVTWCFHALAAERDDFFGEVTAGVEQMSDGGHVLRIGKPHRLAFVDGTQTVYLRADIAGRVFARKMLYLNIFGVAKYSAEILLGVEAEVRGAVGETQKGVESRLKVLSPAVQKQVVVGSEGCGVETGDDDGFGRLCGIGHSAERTLAQIRSRAALQEFLDNLLAGEGKRVGSAEIHVSI